MVIYDPTGRYPELIEHFHKLVARSQNALRGARGELLVVGADLVVRLADREAVIDKLAYTAANPVLDHLVERAYHWPGVNGLSALLHDRPLRATRPLHFFRPDGPMPDELDMALKLPPQLGLPDTLRAELRDRVQRIQAERAAERRRGGGRVLGRRAVLAQSWHDAPGSCELRRNLRPHLAAHSRWAWIEAVLRNRAFTRDYADARARWQDGVAAVFPPGTYWLQRFASVLVSTA